MSNLFGGTNLGTPADRNRLAVISDLALRRKRWKPAAQKTYLYAGTGDFLLREGHFYAGRPCPDYWQRYRGPEGNCFQNALAAAAHEFPLLRYVEGCYWTGQGYAKAHA